MSNVICDVCGTTFPETATHCPICGCAKSPSAQTVSVDEVPHNQERTISNNYARGGRFAKNNTKHNTRAHVSNGRFSSDRSRSNEPQENNKGLIAVVIVLLLAIVMVVIYIGVNVLFTDPGGDPGQSGPNSPQGNDGADGQSIACTSIKLSHKFINLTSENESFELAVIEKLPENTTDNVTYVSADPTIATVDANGIVVPVGYGETIITVTCGSVTEECRVNSTVGDPPVTTVPTLPAATVPAGFTLKLETYKDSGEITISSEGASHKLYKETLGVKASDITWTTSDPAVATVEDGKVVGVDRGVCTITATIGSQTATCLVRCTFDAAEPTSYRLNISSATIAKDESFNLSLQDKETGANVQGIEWQASKEGVVEINGNKITGGTVSKLTAVDVYVEYEGVTYTCKVYVKAPEA